MVEAVGIGALLAVAEPDVARGERVGPNLDVMHRAGQRAAAGLLGPVDAAIGGLPEAVVRDSEVERAARDLVGLQRVLMQEVGPRTVLEAEVRVADAAALAAGGAGLGVETAGLRPGRAAVGGVERRGRVLGDDIR